MNKVSRNDPCPCGSGKKYKKCCIGKILPFPTFDSPEGEQSNSTTDFMEIVKQHFQENKYNSLEEMNSELGVISRKVNSLAKDDFLGLSSTQMHNLLYSPLSLDNEIFKIELASEEELDQVPILNQAVFFLRKIQEVGELKATQKGNLPKLFVIDLYEHFYSKDKYARKPNKEDDLPQVTRLKHLLDISGLIKKRNNKFSLTKKASSILEENKRLELFELIFINFANKWNWAFMDGYPELYFIQQSVAFNFLLIHKKCNGWTLDKDLGQLFIKAFPAIIREVPDSSYSTPEKQVINCFAVRFLNRFCLPLGIVNLKEERIHNGKYFEYLEYYSPTCFFQKNFKFK
jgi:hypothetical protein